MKTLGIRHIALNVNDPLLSKEFYCRVLKMSVEWEPDPENIYLTSGGQDNLALHRSSSADTAKQVTSSSRDTSQPLDHLGFALLTAEDVDHWYDWVRSQNVRILKEIKTHRDGARSFYMADPDGNVIQMIYHAPIARSALTSV